MSNCTVTRGNRRSSRIIRLMPFGRVVSNGRGSFTFKMSFDTGARFRRSTLLGGIDLSWADSPWLHPVAAKGVARIAATAACIENLMRTLRLIDFLVAPIGRIPLRLYRAGPACAFGFVQ